MLAKSLMLAAAAVPIAMGVIHFVYTFRGPQLTPRDPAVRTAIGFNASHSMGAILLGLVYGYLALAHDELLFKSWFLPVVGLAMLCGLLVLAKLYWFRAPFRGVAVALACYLCALAAARLP